MKDYILYDSIYKKQSNTGKARKIESRPAFVWIWKAEEEQGRVTMFLDEVIKMF